MKLEIKRVKIYVTVPEANTEDVINAMCECGAGVIGNYSHCASYTKSTGTFLPNDSANPYIGKSGKLELVKEDKVEVVCDVENVKEVIAALRKTHPYEEPAIDIVPLLDEDFFI